MKLIVTTVAFAPSAPFAPARYFIHYFIKRGLTTTQRKESLVCLISKGWNFIKHCLRCTWVTGVSLLPVVPSLNSTWITQPLFPSLFSPVSTRTREENELNCNRNTQKRNRVEARSIHSHLFQTATGNVIRRRKVFRSFFQTPIFRFWSQAKTGEQIKLQAYHLTQVKGTFNIFSNLSRVSGIPWRLLSIWGSGQTLLDQGLGAQCTSAFFSCLFTGASRWQSFSFSTPGFQFFIFQGNCFLYPPEKKQRNRPMDGPNGKAKMK